MPTESSQRRKLIRTIVTGLVAFMASAMIYLKRQDSNYVDARLNAGII